MKSNVIVILSALVVTAFTMTTFAEETVKPAAPGNVASVKASDTLIVTGRVLEIPGKFPPNDAYDYVYIMKYRVMVVEKGTYASKEILVGHYNPLIPRKLIKDKMDKLVDGTVERFTMGDKHRLALVTIDKCWKGPVEDEYIDAEEEKYFAVKVDVVK